MSSRKAVKKLSQRGANGAVQENVHSPIRVSPPRVTELGMTFFGGPLPMMFFDRASLRIFEVNRAAEDLYQFTREEFLDMTVADIRPPEDAAALADYIQNVDPCQRYVGVWRHRKKDGTNFWVQVFAQEILWREAPARIITMVDIDRWIASQQDLLDMQQRMNLALKDSDVILATQD